MKSPRFRTLAESEAFRTARAAVTCAGAPGASTLRMAITNARAVSKTLSAVRAAVVDSGESANAIAIAAGLNRQTVHEILVNGTGDQTLAKYEAILAAVGKRLVVVDRKK